jgi:rhamnosyltransferase
MVLRQRLSRLRGTAATRTPVRALSAFQSVGLRGFLAAEAWRGRDERGRRAEAPGMATAMVAHVFYPDLLPEVLACLAHMPAGSHCHLTAPPDVAARLPKAALDRPDVTLHTAENRGRDIAPFLALLRSGALDGYDAVLKIHTKRSLHLPHGEVLRKALFASLAGRASVVGNILATMSDPEVGMVGWGRVFLTSPRQWHTNRARVEALAASLQPPAEPRLAFFGGSMFWFRPAAFGSVARSAIRQDDFEPEAGQLDGTLHHALERCFAIAAAASGFSVRDTRGDVLIEAQRAAEAAPAAGSRQAAGG